MNWRLVISIARKDIVDAVKNLYILFAIILPVLMSLLFHLIFSGTAQNNPVSFVLYDPGNSRLGTSLKAIPGMKVTEVNSQAALVEAAKGSTGGLLIPADFDAEVNASRQPEVIVYSNQSRGSNELLAFREMVEEKTWELTGAQKPARLTWSSVSSAGLFASESTQTDTLNHYFLILLVIMGLVMVGVFVVPYILIEEKEKRTLDALLVTPVGPTEVAAGKALVGLFYCTLLSLILMILNKGWAGNWPVTLAAILMGCLVVVAVGLLLGSILHTINQVNTWASIVMLAFIIPSLFAGLVDVPALKAISHLIPTFYLADILTRSLPGAATFSNIWPDFAILLACFVVFFAAVIWNLRRDREA